MKHGIVLHLFFSVLFGHHSLVEKEGCRLVSQVELSVQVLRSASLGTQYRSSEPSKSVDAHTPHMTPLIPQQQWSQYYWDGENLYATKPLLMPS